VGIAQQVAGTLCWAVGTPTAQQSVPATLPLVVLQHVVFRSDIRCDR
jgi:hypothetical protein